MKVIVITGASDGIGAEMARQLASMYGAETALVLAARNVDMLEQVAQQCRQKMRDALWCKLTSVLNLNVDD